MKKILLAEDDPFLIDIYSKKLKEAGFYVKVVKDGKKALDVLKNEKPDLLLLDLVLPELSGWRVIQEIKKDPNFRKLKVVIFSNLGQREEVEQGLELGAVKYLIKAHYKPSEVVEEIKKIINN